MKIDFTNFKKKSVLKSKLSITVNFLRKIFPAFLLVTGLGLIEDISGVSAQDMNRTKGGRERKKKTNQTNKKPDNRNNRKNDIVQPPIDHKTSTKSQDGKIYINGKIIDSVTGESLSDVRITWGDSLKGIFSDLDGNYRITGLPPGSYNLKFSLSAYKSKIINEVKITPDAGMVVNVTLEDAAVTTEDVIIISEINKASENAVLLQQKNSLRASDAMAGTIILKETPSNQLSLALRRMPGVSMTEDRFLTVRGLYERYNSFTYNSSILPYSDFERSGFDFNLIPTNLIQSVKLNKTAGADMVSDFGGTLIDVETVDIPIENSTSFSIQTLYSHQGNFNKFRGAPQTSDGWSLFRTSQRLPDNLSSPHDIYNQQITNPESMFYGADAKKLKYHNAPEYIAPASLRATISLQRRKDIKDKTIGFSLFAALSDIYEFEKQSLNILGNYDSLSGKNIVNDSSYAPINQRTTTATVVFNSGFRFRRGSVSWKQLLSHQIYDRYLRQNGVVFGENTGDSTASDFVYKFPIGRFYTNTLYSSHLHGEYEFDREKTKVAPKLEFDFNFSPLIYDEPQYRGQVEKRVDSLKAYVVQPVPALYNGWFSSLNTAITLEGQFAASFQFISRNKENAKVKGFIKPGLYYYSRGRSYQSRILGLFWDEKATKIDVPSSELIGNDNFNADFFNPDHIHPNALQFREYTSPYHNYQSYRRVFASFIYSELYLGHLFAFNFGVRLENFYQKINNLDLGSGEYQKLIENEKTNILPSFNARYRLGEKQNLKLAFSQTLARANERDLVPLPFLEYALGILTIGNTSLTQTKIQNFDLKWEYFTRPNEILSVGLFYKHLANPIEQTLTEGTLGSYYVASQTYSFSSVSNASVVGAEFDMRINLGKSFDNETLDNFIFYLNSSVSHSKVNVQNFNGLFDKGRRLQGQPNFVINAGTVYKTNNDQWSIGLFYNIAGDRVAFVGVGDKKFADIYEMHRHILDLQIAKKFNKHWLLQLNLPDLINQPFRLIQKYENGNSQIFRSYQKGYKINLQLTYTW